MRFLAAAIVIVLGMGSAGCGGSRERLIPYRAGLLLEFGPPIRRNVPSIPSGASFCRAPDVRLKAAGFDVFPFHQSAYYFEVINRGQSVCVLRGHPVVRFRSEVPVRVSEATSSTDGYPDSGPAWGLRPGAVGSLVVYFQYGDYHGPLGARRVVVTVSLPDSGGGRRLNLPAYPPGATVSLSPFMPPALTEPPAMPWPLRARLEVPKTAWAGDPGLDFVVRLTNVSRRPFRFPYCPGAGARFGAEGTYEAINCHPIGTLAPGESVRLAQRTRVSPYFRPGRRVLEWFIEADDAGSRIEATAPIEILRG